MKKIIDSTENEMAKHKKHMTEITQRLYNLREQYNLSQRELVAQLNSGRRTGFCLDISKSTYNKWEANPQLINVDTLIALCEHYRVSPEYILFGTKDSKDGFKQFMTKETAEQICHLLESTMNKIQQEFDLL